MNDLRESMRRAMAAFEPKADAIDAVRDRKRSRHRRRRIAAASVGVLVFTGGFAALVAVFRPGPRADHPAQYVDRQVTLKAVQPQTEVECLATLAHSVVAPGDTTAFTFRLMAGRRGMGTRPVGSGYLIVQDGDGKQVSGSESGANEIVDNLNMLGMPSGEYPPGFTLPLTALNIPVRWTGPLTVRPACVYDGGVIWLPSVQIQVTPTTPPKGAVEALDSTLAFTGGLFDRCRPAADDSPVSGVIDPPVPSGGAMEMRARCWAKVEQMTSFDVVTLFAVSPPDAPVFELPPQIGSTQLPQLSGGGPIEASRWAFVVTRNDVRVIEPLESIHGGLVQDTIVYDLKDGSWTVTKVCGGGRRGISFFLPISGNYPPGAILPCPAHVGGPGPRPTRTH